MIHPLSWLALSCLLTLLIHTEPVSAREERKCPCDLMKPARSDTFAASNAMLVCVRPVENMPLPDSFESYKLFLPGGKAISIRFQIILDITKIDHCDVILQVVNAAGRNIFGNSTKLNKAEDCTPIPSVSIQKSLEESLEKRIRYFGDEMAITASLTMGSIRNFARKSLIPDDRFFLFALRDLLFRDRNVYVTV